MEKQRIFDIHTHVYPDAIADKAVTALNNFYNFTCEGNGRLNDLISSEREAGIAGFLLLGVATNAHQVKAVNDSIAEDIKTARSLGFEAFGFAGMHQDFADKSAEGGRVLALGLSGFKIHPDIQGADIDNPRFFDLYTFCEGRIPVYFHIGDDRDKYCYSKLDKLYRLAEKFPKLKFCAAHLGGYLDHELALELGRHENAWYDCSSSLWNTELSKIYRLFEKLGVDRIMFGTDYPCKYGKNELERFSALGLDAEATRRVLWDNAMEFLGKVSDNKRSDT